MARIVLPAGESPESHRLLSVQPDMGRAMATLSEAVYQKSGLDLRIREAIRMRVALLNQCQVCLGYRFPELIDVGVDEVFYGAVESWRESTIFSKKEKLAIEYAERFINDHLGIDDDFFEALKLVFTDVEIYEMSTTIAALLANGRILQVLQVEQVCSLSAIEPGGV
ncbi:hypothetical protein A9Q99_25015 [Gammaproteobacteria bacterium 45_16_T64]|nr:hypothetical protein A9Q99_25015 [Gammaproteobacteria bacterium 45_16_T64]